MNDRTLRAAAVCLAVAGAWAQAPGEAVRMNQIQVIGSHNSYHAGIAPSETLLWKKSDPDKLRHLEYRHAPLDEQLSSGVRQIELDIFADSRGGRYAHPAGPRLVMQAGLPQDPPYDPKGVMLRPGFKVMHVPDVDYRSTCPTLVACLETVRDWSRRYPGHLPVFIIIETKQTPEKSEMPITVPEKFTGKMLDAVDAEIRSVFRPEELIVPDDVRGGRRTLEEAVRKDGWPTLARARGKVVFLMDRKEVGPAYRRGHPSLRGRVLFTNGDPGRPEAAFIERNDGSREEIAALVRRGYLVRTRTDADTEEARSNATARRDAALASGAQLLSTDYPPAEPASWTGYQVAFPEGGVARCNPVLVPPACPELESSPRQQ
jgi:hypothetical protein